MASSRKHNFKLWK